MVRVRQRPVPNMHIWLLGQGTRSEQGPHPPVRRLQAVPGAHSVGVVLQFPQVCVSRLHCDVAPHTAGVSVQSGMHTPSLDVRPSGSGMHTYDPGGEAAISEGAARHEVTIPAR